MGSRATPPAVLAALEVLGERLARLGFGLRSGASPGADQAFERGCDRAGGAKQVFLPWPGFEGHPDGSVLDPPTPAALALARTHDPRFARRSATGQRRIVRDGYQVLGADLRDPVRCVVCWTPGGRGQGGTGQAIRIARAHGIPVFDLGAAGARATLEAWLLAVRVEPA